jgi:hypothetical protein
VFGMGLTVSASGIRSVYLLNSTRLLKAILKSDEDIFVNPEKPIASKPEIIRQTCEDLQRELGYLHAEFAPQNQSALIEKLFYQQLKLPAASSGECARYCRFIIHDGSISLTAYRPTVYYCPAVALWDFLPVRTATLAKRCLQLLSECVTMARAAKKEDFCIYSFPRTYREMMLAAEFIGHMQKAIDMIQEISGKDLSKRKDAEILPVPLDSSQLLLTLNF